MKFKNAVVDGINIFYREAGKQGAPKLVLLHGFPSSSHQYRHLMEALAPRFHIVAPDYPGFGNSEMPPREKYAYTFERTAEIVESLLGQIGFTEFGLYMQDYGGPVGFRILNRHPAWAQWLIVQNTNLYELGFTTIWEGLRGEYWRSRSPESEKPLAAFLEAATVKTVYTHGHPDPELISPDNWNMDLAFLDRPGARQVQLDFFYDYRNNVREYQVWQALLRGLQPETLIFWGQGDIFFTPAGGEAYLNDLPNAEVHRLQSGHFAVEDSLEIISKRMISFFDEKVSRRRRHQ
jgi:pimeloyl-ACP methyl ester carboxylesterase